MKIILTNILLIVFLTIKNIKCFKHSLPGDKNWPTESIFQEFKKKLSPKVTLKSDQDYNPFTWNRITYIPKPIAIVKPTNAQDIIQALKFARLYNIRISVQSTGYHQDHRNIYDNSILIDMSSMNSISINLAARTLTLGTGNNFSQIQSFVAIQSNNSLVALGGADPGVGIYGWTVGGGHGLLTRQYGLGVDSIISIDLVLANYSIITASETINQDLFRAIRGSGGGTYGIAISLTVKLYDNPGMISSFSGLYKLSNKTASMFANWMINAPNRVGAYFLPDNLDSKIVTIHATCFGNTSYCSPLLSNLITGCIQNPILEITCQPNYEEYQNFYDFFQYAYSNKKGLVYLSSTVLNSSNIVQGLQDIVTFIDQNKHIGCSGNAVLGGVSSLIDINEEKTSVSQEMRQGLMAITCGSWFYDKSSIEKRKNQVEAMDYFAENILKRYSKWVYWNEPQHNFPSDDWKERYWGSLTNYNKLLNVKQIYDPDGIFTCYHCVGYERFDNEDPSVCPDKCSCSNTPNGVCAYYVNSINNSPSFFISIKQLFLFIILTIYFSNKKL